MVTGEAKFEGKGASGCMKPAEGEGKLYGLQKIHRIRKENIVESRKMGPMRGGHVK